MGKPVSAALAATDLFRLPCSVNFLRLFPVIKLAASVLHKLLVALGTYYTYFSLISARSLFEKLSGNFKRK